jgi:hypothetical protein
VLLVNLPQWPWLFSPKLMVQAMLLLLLLLQQGVHKLSSIQIT